MKRTTTRAALLAGLLAAAAGCAGDGSGPAVGGAGRPAPPFGAGPPASVILVSIGGLLPVHYLGRSGESPVMASLAGHASSGVLALGVIPVHPSASYPAHATLVTGRYPDGHGIAADALLGERGPRRATHWHASHLRAPSLWQAAAAAGLRVAALGWPSTAGAEINWLVPELVALRPKDRWLDLLEQVATPALHQRLRSRFSRQWGEAGEAWPSPAELDRALVDLSCDIVSDPEPPALLLLHLTQADRALTAAGPDSQAAAEALAATDRDFARLVDCLAAAGRLQSAAILVVGDRAIRPVHSQVAPNAVLEAAGLVARDPRSDSGIASWRALAHPSGSAALVYARDEQAALEARRALARAAAQTNAFRVVPASELAELRVDPQAWFGLQARAGYLFTADAGAPLVAATAQRGAAGREVDSAQARVGLVAFGQGLRRGLRIPELGQVDIAPTVAVLLGLPDFEAADGRPLLGALRFDPSAAVRRATGSGDTDG